MQQSDLHKECPEILLSTLRMLQKIWNNLTVSKEWSRFTQDEFAMYKQYKSKRGKSILSDCVFCMKKIQYIKEYLFDTPSTRELIRSHEGLIIKLMDEVKSAL